MFLVGIIVKNPVVAVSELPTLLPLRPVPTLIYTTIVVLPTDFHNSFTVLAGRSPLQFIHGLISLLSFVDKSYQ